MARQRRDLESSNLHHVYNKGVDGIDIFGLDADRIFFEHLLRSAVDDGLVRIHAGVLMTNHIHLIVEALDVTISDVLRDICSRYARRFNWRTERTGPLFDSRFGSVPITGDEQMLTAGRYVHRNPLAFVPAHALEGYRWSSFGGYVGRPAASWITTDLVALDMGPHEYREFVLADWPSDRLTVAGQPALMRTDIADVAAAAEMIGAPEWIAISLAVEMRCADVLELAVHFDRTPAAVRQTAARVRQRRARDTAVDDLWLRTLAVIRNSRERPLAA